MQNDFAEFGDLCFGLGFEILHNRTSIPFITSDNPVCTYNPQTPIHLRVPYDHEDEIELIFPIDAWTLLKGSTKLQPVNIVSKHRDIRSKLVVRKINRTIAQFSYRMAIARDRSSDDLIIQYAQKVPTIEMEARLRGKEIQIIWRHAFGGLPILSKFINTPEKAARLEKQLGKTDADNLSS